MFGLIKTKNLYLVNIAKVTKVIPSGMHTKGATYYKLVGRLYLAQLVKTDGCHKPTNYFKLVTKNFKTHDNHEKTIVGDYYIHDKSKPLTLSFSKKTRYITYKEAVKIEKEANEHYKKHLEEKQQIEKRCKEHEKSAKYNLTRE